MFKFLLCLFLFLLPGCLALDDNDTDITERVLGGKPCSSLLKNRVLDYVVSVSRKDYIGYQPYQRHLCGGTVIKPTYVLTAAHCIYRYNVHEIVVVLYRDLPMNRTWIPLQSQFIHPKYKKGTSQFDIAVVRMAKAVPRTLKWGQISWNPINRPMNQYCPEGFVAGWGEIDKFGTQPKSMMCAKLPLLDVMVCKRAFGSTFLPDSSVCTFTNATLHAYYGDGGAPLICKYTGQVIGVCVGGGSRKGKRLPTRWTRIDACLDFIKSTMVLRSAAEKITPLLYLVVVMVIL